MLLDTINGPADLKRLDADQLGVLAGEIRAVLIEAVAANGGHLGSNLGAVELTLALHRVFDSPRDALVWDTGHQAYVHKLVTGRREGFARLRQAGGMSGYPSRSESEHDLVENSHASTALSYAYGLAVARDVTRTTVAGRRGRRRRCAHRRAGVRSPQQHRLRRPQGRGGPQRQRPVLRTHRVAPHRRVRPSRATLRRSSPRWASPIAARSTVTTSPDWRTRCAAATSFDGPIVVHVLTRKGEGYGPAEIDEEKRLHDIGAFDPETGVPHGSTASSYTGAFAATLVELGERHPELVAITAGMAGSTGLLAFAERFPDRCLDVGIAEQHAVTAAAGMAMRGLRPVVAVYSTFLSRAWDQLVYDVGLHGLPVIFCVDRAGITGDDGASHHGLYDLALLTKVPGMTLFAPSSYEEVG